MRNVLVVYTAAAVTCVLLHGCGGKKERPYVAVVGNDTLTREMISAMRPDPMPDSVRMQRVLVQAALARSVNDPAERAAVDSLAPGFAEQLLLRTAVEWRARDAASLLAAGAALKNLLDSSKTPADVNSAVDTLVRTTVHLQSAGKTAQTNRIASTQVPAAIVNSPAYRDSLAPYLTAFLGVAPGTANLLTDYLRSMNGRAGGRTDMSRMVRNLVADRNAQQQAPRESAAAAAPEPADNSVLVLKYRTQQSIADTINRRQDEIKALYRKYLKMNPDMSGQIRLEIRINPAGKVIATRISAASIGDKRFLEAFAAYAKGIAFMPVPAKVGNMTIEYPFEFTPEE